MNHTQDKKDKERSGTQKKLIEDILRYYKKSGRHDLPWRKNITPYKILVSEIMLQQTQVVRVIEKYKVWIKVYPSLTSLGNTDLKSVLLLWQGLGYQRRAKSLVLIARSHMRLPKKFDELLLLPGVGVYTASALCAFAYNEFAHPMLETNIRTVLIEYFHSTRTSVSDKEMYNDLEQLITIPQVKKLGARHFYYAIMDYGAHLKSLKISHNMKSSGYVRQSTYKGSLRELRAKTLFSITHGTDLPTDTRLEQVLSDLTQEGYIILKNKQYVITDSL